MLLKDDVLRRILRHEISLAFRRFRRPTVRSGGTLRTHLGVLAIDEVQAIEARDISDADAREAGHADRHSLLQTLRGEGTLYRIALRYQGPDERIALRETVPGSDEERDATVMKLLAMDRRSLRGAWTRRTLSLLREKPGVRAADLASGLGMETAAFKAEVRKLKTLGLTVSLEVGYELSRRGHHILEHLEAMSRG